MGLLDFLLGGDDSYSDSGRDWDRSEFDSDRFRNNGSGNWVDWEDVDAESVDDYQLLEYQNPRYKNLQKIAFFAPKRYKNGSETDAGIRAIILCRF